MEPEMKSFAFNLLSKLTTRNPLSNIVISPLSISTILSLTLNGAVGETQKSILKALNQQHISVDKLNEKVSEILKSTHKSDTNVFKIANSIFTKIKPNPEFINLAKKAYLSEVDQLESAKQVNDWVKNQTNNRITEILNDISGIVMILVNTVYFLGEWKYSFDSKSTQKESFYPSKEKEIKVDFMHQKIKKQDVFYFRDEQFEVLKLPYKEPGFNAVIVLPKDFSINESIFQLSESKIKGMLDQSDSNVEIDIHMPKFLLNYSAGLKDVLKSMGMEICFDGRADFTNISEGLFIDDVIHKTFIKVDEKGTEAAAATAVKMLRCIKKEIRMDLNRPFFFMITKEKVEEFCFIAKVMDI